MVVFWAGSHLYFHRDYGLCAEAWKYMSDKPHTISNTVNKKILLYKVQIDFGTSSFQDFVLTELI